MNLSRPLTDRYEICTQVWSGVKAENLISKIFLPDPYKYWRENLNLSMTAVNRERVTSKRLNISTNKYEMLHLG